MMRAPHSNGALTAYVIASLDREDVIVVHIGNDTGIPSTFDQIRSLRIQQNCNLSGEVGFAGRSELSLRLLQRLF